MIESKFLSELTDMSVYAIDSALPCILLVKTLFTLPESAKTAPQRIRTLLRKLELDVPVQRQLAPGESNNVPEYHFILPLFVQASRIIGTPYCVTHVRRAFLKKPHNEILVKEFLSVLMDQLRYKIWFDQRFYRAAIPAVHVIKTPQCYTWIPAGKSTVVGHPIPKQKMKTSSPY